VARLAHILTACGLVEVHVDALQLQVGVPMVGTSGIHAVLIAHHLQRGQSMLRAGPESCSLDRWQ
jgi:hypothetical protein